MAYYFLYTIDFSFGHVFELFPHHLSILILQDYKNATIHHIQLNIYFLHKNQI